MDPIPPIAPDKYWQAIRPITKEEARSFLRREWDTPYTPLKFSDCGALCDFIVECRRVLTAYCARDQISSFSRLSGVMMELSSMKQGPETLQSLRQREDALKRRLEELDEAVVLLERAAILIGVRSTLFYSFDHPNEKRRRLDQLLHKASQQSVPPDELEKLLKNMPEVISKEPPAIVGETAEEHKKRAELNRFKAGLAVNREETIALSNIERHDNRRGAGNYKKRPSTDKLAIRMLWNVWPIEMKNTIKGVWQPNKVAAGILRFCGHEIPSNTVGKHTAEERQREAEASRANQLP